MTKKSVIGTVTLFSMVFEQLLVGLHRLLLPVHIVNSTPEHIIYGIVRLVFRIACRPLIFSHGSPFVAFTAS